MNLSTLTGFSIASMIFSVISETSQFIDLAIFSLVLHIPETTGMSKPFTFLTITVSLGYCLNTFATSNSSESSSVISIMLSS